MCVCSFLCSDSLVYTSFFSFLFYTVFIHVIVHEMFVVHTHHKHRIHKLLLYGDEFSTALDIAACPRQKLNMLVIHCSDTNTKFPPAEN